MHFQVISALLFSFFLWGLDCVKSTVVFLNSILLAEENRIQRMQKLYPACFFLTLSNFCSIWCKQRRAFIIFYHQKFYSINNKSKSKQTIADTCLGTRDSGLPGWISPIYTSMTCVTLFPASPLHRQPRPNATLGSLEYLIQPWGNPFDLTSIQLRTRRSVTLLLRWRSSVRLLGKEAS